MRTTPYSNRSSSTRQNRSSTHDFRNKNVPVRDDTPLKTHWVQSSLVNPANHWDNLAQIS